MEDVSIDVNDFKRCLDVFPEIEEHCQGLDDVFIEKCLEHYLAFRYLGISNDDIYIDIAAAGSPWAKALRARGVQSYRLDRAYRAGIHGMSIGADAGKTQLPDAFASVLSAQCAYECFMGNADVQFVKEAARILNEKGRYGILPLYLEDTHLVAISPYCNQEDVLMESEAKRVWRDDSSSVVHVHGMVRTQPVSTWTKQ
ncbi:MAG: hypothetical protein ABIK79_07590 [Chloroflexota bacterium]